MSSKALNWAFSQDISPAGKKLVLIAMADGADEYGVFWSGYGTLAGKTSLDRATVIRNVNSLVETGYIEKVNRYKNNGEKRSNLYKLALGVDFAEDHPLVAPCDHPPSGTVRPRSGIVPRPEPSLEPINKKTALTRQEFIREIDQERLSGRFVAYTDSQDIIAAEAGNVWDYWEAYPEKKPTGCLTAGFIGWLKKSRAIRAVEKLADKTAPKPEPALNGFTLAAWRTVVQGYVRYSTPGRPVPSHVWNADRLGPAPDQPDTKVPPEIINEFFPDGRIPGENTYA